MIHAAVLYRKEFIVSDDETDEIKAIPFPVFHYRNQIPEHSLVIGRYACLPYYRELEQDLAFKQSKLINSHDEHVFIADIMNWYPIVSDYTPKTFTTWADIHSGKWIVKGRTNSRKFRWNTHMFADGREQLLSVIRKLIDDEFIYEQGLVVREYVPLRILDEGINGMPITAEWRFFFMREEMLSSGFYWTTHPECNPGDVTEKCVNFAKMIAKKIMNYTNFFVLDIAETQSGDFILIEINDGQQSGLSMNDPKVLWKNIQSVLGKSY